MIIILAVRCRPPYCPNCPTDVPPKALGTQAFGTLGTENEDEK